MYLLVHWRLLFYTKDVFVCYCLFIYWARNGNRIKSILFCLISFCCKNLSRSMLTIFGLNAVWLSLLSGWLGEAKVLCVLHHWGVQLILTCSWARPSILAAGKGRVGMFLFLLFLHCHSFSFLLYPSLSSPLLSLFSLSLGDDTKWPTRVDVSLNPNTINAFFTQPKNTLFIYFFLRTRGCIWKQNTSSPRDI